MKTRNKWSMKKKAILIGIPVLVFVLATPLVISFAIGTTDTWIAFWGDYAGGFFSTLIGAGISALVAYFLIKKEVDESIRQETLSRFSLDFNADFQKIKNDTLHLMTRIRALLDTGKNFGYVNYFITQIIIERSELHKLIIENSSYLKKHSYMLLYIYGKNSNFDISLCESTIGQYQLFFYKISELFEEGERNECANRMIDEYIGKIKNFENEYRERIIEIESVIVSVLFPMLIVNPANKKI